MRGYFVTLAVPKPFQHRVIKLNRRRPPTILQRVHGICVCGNQPIPLGHLPGAINVPLRALERKLATLPREREIIAYCRGPYCVLSFEAVALLRERGFNVRRMAEGFPEWQAYGLPIERP